VVVLVTLGTVAAFLQAVIPTMVQQFQRMVTDFPDYVTSLQDRWASLRRAGDQFHITGHIDSVLASLPGRLGSGVFGATGRVFSAVLSTLTVAVFTIYFLADLPRIRKGAVLLFPRTRRASVSRIVDVMVDKVGGVHAREHPDLARSRPGGVRRSQPRFACPLPCRWRFWSRWPTSSPRSGDARRGDLRPGGAAYDASVAEYRAPGRLLRALPAGSKTTR
jgi:hypothetical protein